MKTKTLNLLLGAIILSSITLRAQNTVTIDQSTQRFIGDVSEIDRTKYFNLHSGATGDVDVSSFADTYNVTFGRQFWGPFSATAGTHSDMPNTFPEYTPGTTNSSIRPVSQIIATEHPRSVARYNTDPADAAAFAVEYYLDRTSGNRPEFYEPMNEPFVHAGDAVFAEQQSNDELMRRHMAAYFSAIGKAFDETPELANMKVIGYSSAWPSMELWDFGHWNSRMKMFIDTAGQYMDALATHLYDGINVTGTGGRRSGSNGEAILDLIETYTYSKFGSVTPHAISEYGNIESGYPAGYSHAKSAQSMRSINHFLFNLLDREDRLAISIPFIVDKATWWFSEARNWEPYVPALFIPQVLGQAPNTNWQYSSKIHFYQLWQNVKGKRVFIHSDNPDIQSHAFVDDTKLYVALTNLDDSLQSVNLELLAGIEGLTNVESRTLKIFTWDDPIYTKSSGTEAPASVDLIGDETVVLEYTFNEAISFNDSVYEKNYYTEKHLQEISDSEITFNFDDVELGTGFATLKMGLGRTHSRSKTPILKVNGKQVRVPSNWKGYDQSTRDLFFGTLDIPIPMEFLQTSNTISVKFPDTGGRISSMILKVTRFETGSAMDRKPFFNWPIDIEELIEAEYFDLGDEGIAYSDNDVENTGGAYRSTGVDIEELASGETVVTNTETDEWLEYTVLVPQDLSYRFAANIASIDAGAFRLEVDDVDATGSVTFDATGGDDVFNRIEKVIALEKGTHILKFVIETGGFNLDNFTFEVMVDSIELNKSELSYNSIGRKYTLKYTLYPEEATNQNVTWSTDDANIVSVSELGRIETIGNGTAHIVVTTEDGNKSDTCIVIVDVPTAINNSTLDHSTVLYPNPYKNGTLWLDLRGFENEVEISIVSIVGKLVKKEKLMGGDKIGLDLNGSLSKGLYLVRISADSQSISRKLVVK